MIEEAAGTRMYECKKLAAQKTIEKKEAKLKEICTVFSVCHSGPLHFVLNVHRLNGCLALDFVFPTFPVVLAVLRICRNSS